MSRISLKPGSSVQYNGSNFEIVAATSTTHVLLRSLIDSSQVIAPLDDLRSLSSKEKSTKPAFHPENYDENEWKLAQERFSKIKPLLNCNRTAETVAARAKETGVSSATLYRWINMYESIGKMSALIPALKLR